MPPGTVARMAGDESGIVGRIAVAPDRFMEAGIPAGLAGDQGRRLEADLAGGKPDHDDAVGAIVVGHHA